MSIPFLSRATSKWDQPRESIGTFIGYLHGRGRRYSCWEAKGQAREAFDKLRCEIKECLQASNAPASDIVTWSIYMVGRTEDTASPKVLICSTDQKCRKRIRGIIKDSTIMNKYPGIGLGDVSTLPDRHVIQELAREAIQALIPPEHRAHAKGVVLAEKTQCYVGMQLFVVDEEDYSLRPITAGPFVNLGDVLYNLTIAHTFEKKQTPPDLAGTTELDDCDFEGMSDGELSHDTTVTNSTTSPTGSATSEEADDEAGSSILDGEPPLAITTDVSEAISPDSSRSWAGKLSDDPESATPALQAPSLPDASCLRYFGKVQFSSLTDKTSFDFMDYTLIQLADDAEFLGRYDFSGRPISVGIIGKDDIAITALMRRGSVPGILTATPSYICLPGYSKFALAYTARLKTTLASGDCGSAIIDRNSREFYGHLIAGGRESNIGYLISAAEVFKSMMRIQGMPKDWRPKFFLGREKPYSKYALQGVEKALGPDHTLTLSTTNNLAQPPQPCSIDEVDGDSDGRAAGFDVYARPFVPKALKHVNLLAGYEYHTAPSRTIDFGALVRAYLIPGLLPPLGGPPSELTDAEAGGIPCAPNPENYEPYFRRHLQTEIRAQDREYEYYALYDHDLGVSGSLPVGQADALPAVTVIIDVPGLRENSPYVEEEDLIQIRQLCDAPTGPVQYILDDTTGQMMPTRAWTGNIYSGRVETVLRARERLIVRVDGPLLRDLQIRGTFVEPMKYRGKFNVRFFVPRDRTASMFDVLSHTRRLSANAGLWLRQMLFPEDGDCALQGELDRHVFEWPFFDSSINYEQAEAVQAVCARQYGSLPYLISGPPGTGKTLTLIETARQLVRLQQVAHILMCSPSDPAADILVKRLGPHFKPDELLRLNRPTRTFAEVPDSVLPFCYVQGTSFGLPPFPRLMGYRIVVTTCRDASMLMYARMTNTDLYAVENGFRRTVHPHEQEAATKLHWGGLLLDEAAQATEPQALIPMWVVAPPPDITEPARTPFVVMAGDQHQLNPRTSLPSSRLRESLFARLFARPVYANHPLARDRAGRSAPMLRDAMLPILRPAFTNLTRNYRSHPAILAVPSNLFYADTLRAEAADTARLEDWSGWRGRGWPVLFHGNNSPDDIERDGGGWYNTGEARVACTVAARLLETGRLRAGEICIMSPFQAQVRRLRKKARASSSPYRLGDINIGPCEAFQGLESGVVILCTTRSRRRFLDRDRELGWGIVGAPNLMNVALTRAKFGLIVVGCREVLASDPHWRAFLAFCDRNGLVEGDGVGPPAPDGAAEARRLHLEGMLLHQEKGPESMRVLGREVEEDPMWANALWDADE